MKRLIVTADDFGHDPGRNRGILEAHRKGIVTGTSLLANGSAFEDALACLSEAPNLSVGLHLNLSEGIPVSRGLRTLVGADGNFLGKEVARAAIRSGRVSRGEIAREARAQVARLAERGIRVSHFDGHQHIHIYPVAREILAETMAALGIRTVRIPEQPVEGELSVLEGEASRLAEYARLAAEARRVYRRHGLRGTPRFRGLATIPPWIAARLLSALRDLPEGWTEVMTHPGYPDPEGGPFSGADRETELRVLTDPATVERVKEECRLSTWAQFAREGKAVER